MAMTNIFNVGSNINYSNTWKKIKINLYNQQDPCWYDFGQFFFYHCLNYTVLFLSIHHPDQISAVLRAPHEAALKVESIRSRAVPHSPASNENQGVDMEL